MSHSEAFSHKQLIYLEKQNVVQKLCRLIFMSVLKMPGMEK